MIGNVGSRRRRWVLLGLLLAAGGGILAWSLASTDVPGPTIPTADLRDAEPLVRRAVEQARAAVVEEPGFAEAWGHLGRVYDAHHLGAEADLCYREASRLDPDDYRWPYLRATCSLDMSPARTLGLLERARTLHPSDVPILLRLGFLYLQAGGQDDADRAFRAALEGNGRSSHALLGLARIALDGDDLKGGRELLERAAAIAPQHREIHAFLAEVLDRLGDGPAASQSRERANALTGAFPIPDPERDRVKFEGRSRVHLVLHGRTALTAGQPGEAAWRLAAALEVRDDPLVRADLGRALLAGGQVDVGIRELRRTLEQKPDHRGAQAALGHALVRSGHRREGMSLLESAVARGAHDRFRVFLARELARDGRHGDTCGLLQKFAQNPDGEWEGALLLAWTLATAPRADERDPKEALRILGLLQLDHGGNFDVLETAAAALAAAGRFEEAVRNQESALRAAQGHGAPSRRSVAKERLKAYREGRPWIDG